MDKKSLSHTAWKCQYHIVFIPKYRKKQLYGQVRTGVREIIQTLCRYKGIEIIEGAVCLDHVHLSVSIPPKMSISTFMGYLKLMIYDRHPSLQNKWNKAFWARGYYVATIGNVTEEAIKKYITEQSEESRKEDSEGAVFLAVASNSACNTRLLGVQVIEAPWGSYPPHLKWGGLAMYRGLLIWDLVHWL